MKKKSARNSRKGLPLSIDLRDFLMYTNPSKFAPKLRANGGEAFPQAPTMDQFFSYGAPTPQTPFVFQDGGANNFSGDNVNRRSNFLNKVKEAAYRKLQEELENEAMGYEEEANMMFQVGGPFQMDFSKANAWAKSIQPYNLQESASNFATLWDAAQYGPTETYIKGWKNIPVPKAQTGLNFNDVFGDQANLPFDHSGDYVAGSDPFVGMTRDERLVYEREKRGYNSDPRFMLPPTTAGDQGIMNQVNADVRAREMGIDPLTGKRIAADPADWRNSMLQPPTNQPKQEKSIVDKAVEDANKEKDSENKSPEAVVVKNPDGTESTLSPEEAAKRKAEEDKKKAGDTPAAGSEEESKQAAAAGMSPAEYRTFLTRMTPNMRRAILPGNRLKSMDFYFDTYGPNGQLLPTSWNQAGAPGSAQGAPGVNTGAMNTGNPRNNRDINYTQVGNQMPVGEMSNGKDQLALKSMYDPRGYNNAYSEGRNQNFQNRRRNLGQKLDELYQRQGNMQEIGQGLSRRETNRLNRLENRYNRIGTRRDAPGLQGPSTPETFSDYMRPEYIKQYGGYLQAFEDGGYYQYGGEDDPYGTAGYSTDGYDTSEREDYAGNTIYEQAPDINQNNGNMTKVGSSGMRALFGHYNPYEAPMMLAGLQGIAGFMDRRDQFKRRNEYMDKTGADQVYTKTWDNDKGDYEMNSGDFRPNQKVPVQFSGYNNQSFTAKMGGSLSRFDEGGASVTEKCPDNYYWDFFLQECVPFEKGIIPMEQSLNDPIMQDYLRKLNYKKNVEEYKRQRSEKVKEFKEKNNFQDKFFEEFKDTKEYQDFYKQYPDPYRDKDFVLPDSFEQKEYFPSEGNWDEDSKHDYIKLFDMNVDKQKLDEWKQEQYYKAHPEEKPQKWEEREDYYQNKVPALDPIKTKKFSPYEILQEKYDDWCPCAKMKEVIVAGVRTMQKVCVPCEEGQAQYGGLAKFVTKGSYKKGGEYYLSDDEINELIQNGGEIEYLD